MRGDERAKQAAASSTNGVVGSTGKKMPMIPASRASTPAMANRARSQGRGWCRAGSGGGFMRRSGR